jgi:hypothetical protein
MKEYRVLYSTKGGLLRLHSFWKTEHAARKKARRLRALGFSAKIEISTAKQILDDIEVPQQLGFSFMST